MLQTHRRTEKHAYDFIKVIGIWVETINTNTAARELNIGHRYSLSSVILVHLPRGVAQAVASVTRIREITGSIPGPSILGWVSTVPHPGKCGNGLQVICQDII